MDSPDRSTDGGSPMIGADSRMASNPAPDTTRPEILHWTKQYKTTNANVLTRREWIDGHLGVITSNGNNGESSEDDTPSSEGTKLLQNRKFLHSIVKELNSTEWMFAK